MSLAILYVNSRDSDGKYVKEASRSAASFRRHLPHAKFYLYTNYEFDDEFTAEFDAIVKERFYVPEVFQSRVHLNGQMIVKHKAMLELSEQHVLYLGADTFALKPEVGEIERVLDRFEIAAAHAPVRINTELGNSSIPEVPRAFPELNCDLILYRNDERVRTALSQWRTAYLDDMFSHPHDQGTFRYVLYQSDLSVCVLPQEYNYRGHDYRDDTIILQNRYALDQYLDGKGGVFSRSWKRLVRSQSSST